LRFLIKLMDQYSGLAYRLTLLEVQKLAYFTQEAGEPLRLRFVAGFYGPYADNLNKVLQALQGHFTRGYGDSPKPDRDIELLPGAVDAANATLEPGSVSYQRLQTVVGTTAASGEPCGYTQQLIAGLSSK
jgi:hypothetical protein